jgi:hypothetical protein
MAYFHHLTFYVTSDEADKKIHHNTASNFVVQLRHHYHLQQNKNYYLFLNSITFPCNFFPAPLKVIWHYQLYFGSAGSPPTPIAGGETYNSAKRLLKGTIELQSPDLEMDENCILKKYRVNVKSAIRYIENLVKKTTLNNYLETRVIDNSVKLSLRPKQLIFSSLPKRFTVRHYFPAEVTTLFIQPPNFVSALMTGYHELVTAKWVTLTHGEDEPSHTFQPETKHAPEVSFVFKKEVSTLTGGYKTGDQLTHICVETDVCDSAPMSGTGRNVIKIIPFDENNPKHSYEAHLPEYHPITRSNIEYMHFKLTDID